MAAWCYGWPSPTPLGWCLPTAGSSKRRWPGRRHSTCPRVGHASVEVVAASNLGMPHEGVLFSSGTVPMFPMPLAEGPMSLVAQEDRFAVSIGLHICPQQGNITKGG